MSRRRSAPHTGGAGHAGDGNGNVVGGSACPVVEIDASVDIERDRELVERCQAGDGRAFDELYRRYHRRLTLFCLRRVGEAHEAEDAAQEAFARAWRALPRFGGNRRFYPWLTVIAANVCTDLHRRRSPIVSMGEVPEPRGASELWDGDAEERLVSEVDHAIAAQAVRRLSPRYQRVLALREGSGWSSQSIANCEGTTVSAVETLLWRARQALRKEFAAVSDSAGSLGVALAFVGTALWRALRRTSSRAADRCLPLLHGTGASPLTVSTAAGTVLAAGTVAAALLTGGMTGTVLERSLVQPPPVTGGRLQAVPAGEVSTASTSVPGAHGLAPLSFAGNWTGMAASTSQRGTSPVTPDGSGAYGPGGAASSLWGTGGPGGGGSAISGALGGAGGSVSGAGGSVSGVAGTAGSTTNGAGSTAAGLVSTTNGVVSTTAGLTGSAGGMAAATGVTASGLTVATPATASGLTVATPATASGAVDPATISGGAVAGGAAGASAIH